MVKASTPMLKRERGEAVDVTTLRMCCSVICTSDVANAIPQVKAK